MNMKKNNNFDVSEFDFLAIIIIIIFEKIIKNVKNSFWSNNM